VTATAPPEVVVEVLDAEPGALEVELQLGELEGDEWRVTARVHNRGESAVEGAVRLSVSIPSTAPFWLIPGAFYGENRPADNDRVFPRFESGATSLEQHAAMVSDEWHFRADRSATPAVFCWPDEGVNGVAIATTESGELGLQALGLRHRDGVATISITAPAREYPVTYYGSQEPRTAEVRSATFAAGSVTTLTATVHALTADRHDYAPVLRRLHSRSAPRSPLRPRSTVEQAASSAADGLLRWHYDPDPGVLLETAGFDRELKGADGRPVDRQAMHVGWVSGIPWATAMLQHASRTGRDDVRAAAVSVIDFVCDALSPSGTFWGVWYRASGWRQSWTPVPGGVHSRTLGEATHFLVRALDHHDAPHWRTAALSNLEAVMRRQRTDGNLGALHHAETGEVLSWRGSAGLAWVPAFVEAHERGWGDRFLDAALLAGEYYSQFVLDELLHGAPEDVDLAPTSEDGYVAIMAYMALHRVSSDARWLELARRAADWMLTFRYSYNVEFSPDSMLGVYGFGSRGADQASSSNQHLHSYGLICTQELFALSEATGDSHYAERAEETLACFRQLVPLADGDFNAYRGMITERYYQTACFQPKGMVHVLAHAWCAGVLLLGCEQSIARAGRSSA